MRLCHIVPSLESHQGGPSVSVPQLAFALGKLDHQIELLTTAPAVSAGLPSSDESDGTTQIETFRRDWPQRICPSAGLHDRLKRSGAEIFHHHSLWLRTLHYAHVTARTKGAKLVLSPRGMMNEWAWRHHPWRKRLARILVHPGALHAVDGWHATSKEEAADIAALGFRQPVCIAPNGVNAPVPADQERARAHWLGRCPEAGTRRVALFYSRFHRKKRVLELIDLWLKCAPVDWLLLLVGISEEYTPQILDDYVHRASGTSRVRIFSGENQPPPYGLASLFLLPSHSENFGLVIAEAMAHGVPALVTDGTPWTEINRDERGWCVSWNDYGDALRSATAESDAQLRARGARAKAWVLADFSWEKSARFLADFYRTLSQK